MTGERPAGDVKDYKPTKTVDVIEYWHSRALTAEQELERHKLALAYFMQHDPDVDRPPSKSEFWRIREAAERALSHHQPEEPDA